MTPYHNKITLGELRASGVRDVLIYCRDHRCSPCSAAMSRIMRDDAPVRHLPASRPRRELFDKLTQFQHPTYCS